MVTAVSADGRNFSFHPPQNTVVSRHEKNEVGAQRPRGNSGLVIALVPCPKLYSANGRVTTYGFDETARMEAIQGRQRPVRDDRPHGQ